MTDDDDEGQRLASAIRAYNQAYEELAAARAAWKRRIAPARGWAKDPFNPNTS